METLVSWALGIGVVIVLIVIVKRANDREAEKHADEFIQKKFDAATDPEDKRYWRLTAKHRKVRIVEYYNDDDLFEELKFLAAHEIFNDKIQNHLREVLKRVEAHRERFVNPERQREAEETEAARKAAAAEMADARTEKALTRSLTTLAETTRALKPDEDHSEIVNMIDAELRIIDRECPEPITDETARVTLSFLRKRLDECAVNDPVLDLHLSRLLQRIPTEASSSPPAT